MAAGAAKSTVPEATVVPDEVAVLMVMEGPEEGGPQVTPEPEDSMVVSRELVEVPRER